VKQSDFTPIFLYCHGICLKRLRETTETGDIQPADRDFDPELRSTKQECKSLDRVVQLSFIASVRIPKSVSDFMFHISNIFGPILRRRKWKL
jgi:hypothetical protein